MSFVRHHHRAKKNQNRQEKSQLSTEQDTIPTSDATFTPYQNKNLSLQVAGASDGKRRRSIKSLKCLTNTNWHVCFVSPLFNWGYEERKLKFYARRLKERIISQNESDLIETYEVSYASIPNLRFYDYDDPAVEIMVYSIMKDEARKMIYNGILLSWGVNKDTKPTGCTYVPLLLWKGSAGISKLLHLEFQQIHDCVISPNSFKDEDIRCLVAGYFASLPDPANDSFSLKYFVPKLQKSGKLSVTLSTECLSKLWESVSHSGAHRWTIEEVNCMWEDIQRHISSCFGIDLDYFHLEMATLSNLSLSTSTVKGRNIEMINLVLSYLMGHCILVESVVPNLHRSL